ncbi:MAG: hypothetical protein GF344_09645 [Chitinivibrionales bacterium]|nr:hypothetical protein [Chitinivibrionales bacterium]MBD3357105.1 hypothetical protein [Chitinivibrionales bacterium]
MRWTATSREEQYSRGCGDACDSGDTDTAGTSNALVTEEIEYGIARGSSYYDLISRAANGGKRFFMHLCPIEQSAMHVRLMIGRATKARKTQAAFSNFATKVARPGTA